MKILVIGSGFIGSSIIQYLEMEGHELLIFSKTFKKGIQSEQLVGDIFFGNDFSKALSWGPHVIIHTAWVTTHGKYVDDPSNFHYAQFTADLAKSVAGSDLEHLIILGTCGEYGPQTEPSIAGITELNPISFYARQKVEALNSVKNLLLDGSPRLTWARVFQPYGPHQDKNRLIPYLIKSIKEKKQIELKDTSSVLDWISTRDIASAISWIISHDTPTEVDVGTTTGYTNLEILQHLETKLGYSNQLKSRHPEPITRDQMILVGKNSPLFLSGWHPSDSLDLGLEWVLNS